MDIINIFNSLINIRGIHIKKLYRLNKDILENNILEIKNIYCKHRTNKENLCLNKCIEDSKYCSIHDPIKREEKRINRINRKIKLKEEMNIIKENKNKIFNEIIEEIIIEEDNKYKALPEYEIYPKPSAPDYEDIKYLDNLDENTPILDQKPDEVGCVIKNSINNNIFNEKINDKNIIKVSEAIKEINVRTIKHYKKEFIKKGDILFTNFIDIINVIESRNEILLKIINEEDKNILPIINPLLLNNEKDKIITDIEDYKIKLTNLDYNNLGLKGVNYQKLYKNIIELQFKLLLSKNSNNHINSKLIKFINKIVNRIPK